MALGDAYHVIVLPVYERNQSAGRIYVRNEAIVWFDAVGSWPSTACDVVELDTHSDLHGFVDHVALWPGTGPTGTVLVHTGFQTANFLVVSGHLRALRRKHMFTNLMCCGWETAMYTKPQHHVETQQLDWMKPSIDRGVHPFRRQSYTISCMTNVLPELLYAIQLLGARARAALRSTQDVFYPGEVGQATTFMPYVAIVLAAKTFRPFGNRRM